MQGLNPITMQCTYSTPCGWCTKWDKKCDKKIGCGGEKPKPVSASISVRSGVLDSAPVDPRSTVLQNKLD
jgi:hypothetical protein